VERDIARTEEILELPFPLPEDLPDPKRSEAILRSCARRLRRLGDELKNPRNLLKGEELVRDAQLELDDFVCDYFQICPWERELIEDTVNVFRPSSTPGAIDSDGLITARLSTVTQRRQYADTLTRTFRGWTKTTKHLWAEGHVATGIGLGLITMGISDVATKYAEFQAAEHVETVLNDLCHSTVDRKMNCTLD